MSKIQNGQRRNHETKIFLLMEFRAADFKSLATAGFATTSCDIFFQFGSVTQSPIRMLSGEKEDKMF